MSKKLRIELGRKLFAHVWTLELWLSLRLKHCILTFQATKVALYPAFLTIPSTSYGSSYLCLSTGEVHENVATDASASRLARQA